MARRYFSATPIHGDTAVLEGPEAHHLLHVLRAAAGDRVTLFDGSGAEFDAEVIACRRSEVELAVRQRFDVDREWPFSLVLAAPLPKGERQRWLIEKSVELGVTQFVPLWTERCTVAGETRAAEKLNRYVVEASKQCGRNRLMDVAAPQAWPTWLALPSTHIAAGSAPSPRLWVADPSGQTIDGPDLGGARPTYAAVGPEGGFTRAEVAAAVDHGWNLVSLGPRTLRLETAAVALATLATALFKAPDAPRR